MTLFGRTKLRAHLSNPNIYFLMKSLSVSVQGRKEGGKENRRKAERIAQTSCRREMWALLALRKENT